MIRVLYDHQGTDAAFGGVVEYFNRVIGHLPKDICPVISSVRTINPFLQMPPFNVKPTEMTLDDFRQKWLKGHSFRGVGRLFILLGRLFPHLFPCSLNLNVASFRKHIREGDFEIYHLTKAHPIHDEAGFLKGRKPVVATVHDLIPDLAGDHSVIRGRRRTLSGVSHVITVSESTKKDLQDIYGIPDEKVTVIHHGFMPFSNERKSRLPNTLSFLRGLPYIIYVGRREGYKNFDWFLDEISPILKSRNFHLLCTGRPFSKQEESRIRELGISGKLFSMFLTEQELHAAYANAVAFVYPSLREGFGIPILDAFSARCPVVLPNSSCFPEVAEAAGLYFNQGDGEAMRQQICQLYDNLAIRSDQIAKGAERLKMFSWRKSAEAHAQVYRRVLEEKKD